MVLIVDGEPTLQELTVMVDPDHPGLDVAQLNRQELMEFLMTSGEEED